MGRLLLWVGLVLVLEHHDGAAYKLVCYFSNWARSRPSPASILPQDLDPFLCTHLIFAFASMNNSQIVPKDLQDEKILYPQFNKLKERNTELKTLLSIGGWNFGTARFSSMLSTSVNRSKFADSVISLLRMHGFDGLDLFFLYPGLRSSPMHDRWTFLFLVEELLLAFQNESMATLRPRLLLSAAVSGVPYIIETSYEVHLLGRLLDFINVLSYDFHGSWEVFTGHNSPLLSQVGDPKSSAFAMNYWRKLGAPSEKLIMGLPTYGRTFHLLKASKNGLQAKAIGPSSPGKYTKQAGFLAYYEICSFIQRAEKHWIDYQFVPYAYKGKEWVGYDDIASFTYKAFFIMQEHFGGAMVWTLDLDDVRGTFCGTGPFPLVRVLKTLLVEAEFSSTSSPQSWNSSSVNSSTIDPGKQTVTKALTTDFAINPLGRETVATEIHKKYENMTTVPRGVIVTPRRETVTPGKLTVSLKGKNELLGGTTMTRVGPQSVTPGGTTMTPVRLQTETLGRMTMTPGRKALTPVKVTVPSGEMTVTSDGQTVTLRGENLTSEVDTQMGDLGLQIEAQNRTLSSAPAIQLPEYTTLAFDNDFVPVDGNHSSANSVLSP
ncbi:oviduct-specific glycoprotein [Choloepus didactylus]|uniref:oviduct-specific glycoprotein n=1 Tax=Choloepus didactylus TaxID=27675 RepID=UPI0018A11D8E|nr:oviduct-specific glycoprotein [Choloepus didactylus]